MIGDQGAEGDGTLYIIIPAADQLPACLSFKERIISSLFVEIANTVNISAPAT